MPPERHEADYARGRLAEIKAREHPNGNTIQMIADIEWLIDEVEYLRESRADWRDMTLHGTANSHNRLTEGR
jgi:hypothetical protein